MAVSVSSTGESWDTECLPWLSVSQQMQVLYSSNADPSKVPYEVSFTADLSQYRAIEIMGATDEWDRCSCRIPKPAKGSYDSVHFSLVACHGGSDVMYARFQRCSIAQSGTKVTIAPNEFNLVSFMSSSMTLTNAQGICIVQVAGIL